MEEQSDDSDIWRECMWLKPDPTASGYDQNYRYAITIRGHEYAERVWGLEEPLGEEAMRRVSFHEDADGKWAGPFEDLRCCLYYLQRTIRWNEQGFRDDDTRCRYDRLYEAICEAWEREHVDHPDEVAHASRSLQRKQHGL